MQTHSYLQDLLDFTCLYAFHSHAFLSVCLFLIKDNVVYQAWRSLSDLFSPNLLVQKKAYTGQSQPYWLFAYRHFNILYLQQWVWATCTWFNTCYKAQFGWSSLLKDLFDYFFYKLKLGRWLSLQVPRFLIFFYYLQFSVCDLSFSCEFSTERFLTMPCQS